MSKTNPLVMAFAETLTELRERERAGMVTADLAAASGFDGRYRETRERDTYPGLPFCGGSVTR